MEYGLPKTVNIDNDVHAISSDYRDIIDICTMLTDDTLTDSERVYCSLFVFYRGRIPADTEAALKAMMNFIAAGTTAGDNAPEIVNWEKDYPIIVSAVNRVLGMECRAQKYLHWWTFIGAYMEVGDCLLSQVLNIRDKKARGKKLEKYEMEFAKRNAALIELPRSQNEIDIEEAIRGGASYA